MNRLPQAPFIRTTIVALSLSAIAMLATLARAITIEEVEASGNPATAALARSTSTPPTPQIDLEAVGGNDIFQPDRNPLPYRYRMPGESAPATESAPAEVARPVVLGTVIATDGAHFATCQLQGGRPTVVRTGDRIGEYTVIAIERGKVTFKNDAGMTFDVAATRPGTSK